MKKGLLFTLACVLLLGCTACGSDVTPTATPDVTPDVTPTPEPKDTEFLASELIKNAKLWNGERLFNDHFQFVVEYQDDCVIRDKLGVNYNVLGGDFIHNIYSTGEWGYAIMNLDGLYNGVAKIVGPKFEKTAKNRQEALDQIMSIITNFDVSQPDLEKQSVMTGHYPWQHYGGMAGFKSIGVETGEGISATQFRVAMTRGAAKQYGTPWFTDFSQWFGGYLLDYRTGGAGFYKENSSATGGHSLNQMERTVLYEFMSGSDVTIAEGGQCISYYDDGSLSPYGKLMQKMYKFTTDYEDVGTTYTPFAFIMDKYHGMGHSGINYVYDMFAPNAGDIFNYDILNKYIWYKSLDGTWSGEESSQMVNTQFGDTFDFFLQGVSAELIETYPVLIFTGNIKMTDEERQKYVDYVKNGGILVLNTAYASQFSGLDVEIPNYIDKVEVEGTDRFAEVPYTEVAYGKGSFMLYGKGGKFDVVTYRDGTMEMVSAGDWKLGGLYEILTELHNRFVPFNFSQQVGYTMTVKDKALYLMVYNNDGVTKMVNVPEEVDETKGFTLDIEYTGGYLIHSAEDVYNGHEIRVNGNMLSVDLEAGGIALIELKIGQQ